MATSTHNHKENNEPSHTGSAKVGISGFAQASSETPKTVNRSVRVDENDFQAPPTRTPITRRSDVIRMQTSTNKGSAAQRNKFLIPGLVILLLALVGFMSYKYIFEKVNFVTPIPGLSDIVQDIPGLSGGEWENPINGMYFTNQQAAEFKDKKPIAVMVNNYVDARPSSGLSQADIVYEAVAEGGITRIMPIFYSRIPEMVISLRSARYYFVELAAPYAPHYLHWGAAHVPPCQIAGTCAPETEPDVDAYSRIVQLGLPNLDAGNYACQNDAAECSFGRDSVRLSRGIALEHTGFARLPKVYEKAKEIRPEESWHKFVPLTVQWKFKDEASIEDRGDIGVAAAPITYNYWDTMPGFNVKWEYDKEKNEYVRYQGNEKQIDMANDQELRAKVVIVRFTRETPVGDKKNHLYQQIVGTGDALIFQDGKVTQAKWNRVTHEELDKYTDLQGNEVEFVRGQIWVQLVQIGNKVNYEPAPATTTGGQ